MKKIVCLSCFFLFFFFGQAQLQPIGSWREHLPYHSGIGLAAGGETIFCATPYSFFSVDPTDNSLHRYSKLTGLSETGLNSICYDSATDQLVIGYANSNVDLVRKGLVKNIDALKRTQLSGDKTINSISCSNGKAYLSTGLGIVVIDENRYEVKDTYVIGAGGVQVKVNALAVGKNNFYAATTEGLKQAPVTGSNLADYRNWTSLSQGAVESVVTIGSDDALIRRNDSLFIWRGGILSFFYRDGFNLTGLFISGDRIAVTERSDTSARVVFLNTDGSVSQILQHPVYIRDPRGLVTRSGEIWIADAFTGLIKVSGNSFTSYVPNSPLSVALGDLAINGSVLWAASGAVDASWQGTKNKNGLYQFANDNWKNLNGSNIPAMDSFPDLITLAIDPRDQTIWAGSFGGGLLQVKPDQTISIFKQNSPLQSPNGSAGVFNVSGLAFDSHNNLWIANFGANQDVLVRKADGTWRSFVIPFYHQHNAVSQILVDDADQVWIVSPAGNGLFCFNHGASIDNTADDKWRFFSSGPGNGNLPDNNVRCIAKDRNGLIWIGTAAGIGVIQCAGQIFGNPSCEAILPVVQQGNFNGYLFRDEQVQAIAVDGANRKWIGTKKGIWLISEEGEKVISHFTEDNSSLLGNDVRSIAVDGISGEVYISTLKGICSFRGTATEGGSTNSAVIVFPNPVPPTYYGPIAIRGLVNNAVVKITEMDGRLVFETRALGGQAIWNGRDGKGNRVSSGVYLVLVKDENGKENLVTKIAFIH